MGLAARVREARAARDRSKPVKYRVLRAERNHAQKDKAATKAKEVVEELEAKLADAQTALEEAQLALADASAELRRAREEQLAEPAPARAAAADAAGGGASPACACSLSELLEAMLLKCQDPIYDGLLGGGGAADFRRMAEGVKGMASNFEAAAAAPAAAQAGGSPRARAPTRQHRIASGSDTGGAASESEAAMEVRPRRTTWAERVQAARTPNPLPMADGPVGHRPPGCALVAADMAAEADGLLASRRARELRRGASLQEAPSAAVPRSRSAARTAVGTRRHKAAKRAYGPVGHSD